MLMTRSKWLINIKMKKILLFLVFLFPLFSLGQVSSCKTERIANATTSFGITIPKGDEIIDLNTGNVYLCTTATAGTYTLTTASGNFTLVSFPGFGFTPTTALSGNYRDSIPFRIKNNTIIEKDTTKPLFIGNNLIGMNNAGINGGWVWESDNPTISKYSGEPSVLVEGDTAWLWHWIPDDTISRINAHVYLRYSTDSKFKTWSSPVQVLSGIFNCVFKIASTYYMILKDQFVAGNLYMYQSTNRTSWTIMNGGNPIITQSSDPTSNFYYIYNTSVAIVDTTMHLILVAQSNAGSYGLYYSHAGLHSLSNFQSNLSPTLLSYAGDPVLKYIPARNAFMLLYSNIYYGPIQMSWTDARYAYLSSSLSSANSWMPMRNFPIIYKYGLLVADPELVETPNHAFKLLYMAEYNQQAIYQAYSTLTLQQLFDISIKNISNIFVGNYTGIPLTTGICNIGQFETNDLLVNGASRFRNKIIADSIPITTNIIPYVLVQDTEGFVNKESFKSLVNAYVQDSSKIPFYFKNNCVIERDTTKKVGINTTTPIAALDVEGSSFIKGGNGDVSYGGGLTYLDSEAINSYLMGGGSLTNSQYAAGDIFGIGSINKLDYYALLRGLTMTPKKTISNFGNWARTRYRHLYDNAIWVDTTGNTIISKNLGINSVSIIPYRPTNLLTLDFNSNVSECHLDSVFFPGYRIKINGDTINNVNYHNTIDSVSTSIPYSSTLTKALVEDTTTGKLYRRSFPSGIANGDTIGEIPYWNGSAWTKAYGAALKWTPVSKSFTLGGTMIIRGDTNTISTNGKGSLIFGGDYLDFNISGIYKAYLSNTAFSPWTNNNYDLGASGLKWKDIYAAGTIYGNLTGNVTGNTSGSSGSCTGNAATVTNGLYTTDRITTTGTSSTKVMSQGAVKNEVDSVANLKTLTLPTIPASNSSVTGLVELDTANVNMGIGDVVFIGGTNSDRMVLCKADAIADCPYCIAICTGTVTAGNVGTYLTHGDIRYDSWTWTKGGLIYISTTGTTGNTLTQTAPLGANNVIMPIGVAKTAHVIKFFGNLNSVEHN